MSSRGHSAGKKSGHSAGKKSGRGGRKFREGPWRNIRETTVVKVKTDDNQWKLATPDQLHAWENRWDDDGHGGTVGNYKVKVTYNAGHGIPSKFEIRRIRPDPPGNWREIKEMNVAEVQLDSQDWALATRQQQKAWDDRYKKANKEGNVITWPYETRVVGFRTFQIRRIGPLSYSAAFVDLCA